MALHLCRATDLNAECHIECFGWDETKQSSCASEIQAFIYIYISIFCQCILSFLACILSYTVYLYRSLQSYPFQVSHLEKFLVGITWSSTPDKDTVHLS